MKVKDGFFFCLELEQDEKGGPMSSLGRGRGYKPRPMTEFPRVHNS